MFRCTFRRIIYSRHFYVSVIHKFSGNEMSQNKFINKNYLAKSLWIMPYYKWLMRLHHSINSLFYHIYIKHMSNLVWKHPIVFQKSALYKLESCLTTFGKAVPERPPRTASHLLSPVEPICSISSNMRVFTAIGN